MSGGHYDYEQEKIRRVTEVVSRDLSGPPDPEKPWLPKDPVLALLVLEVGNLLYATCDDVDRHISGDTEIPDIGWYRQQTIDQLRDILVRLDKMA